MDFLSPSQCRAARALLNWSQPDLAEKCGMHVQTISNFEQENGSPTKTTLTTIREVLENAGIRFLEDNGVKEVSGGLRILKGQTGFRDLYDDIYDTAVSKNFTEITLFNGVSKLVFDALGQSYLDMHIERMVEIKKKFRFRVIVKEGDTAYLGARYCEYKSCPPDRFKNKTIYTYGTKVGLIDFSDSLTIALFDEKHFAETQLQSFDLAWDYIAKAIN